MRAQLANKIPEKGKTVWRIYGLLQSLAVLLLAVGGGVATYFLEGPKWIYVVITAVWVIFFVLWVIAFPNIRHNIWRYEVREKEIEIQSGLFVVKNTLIPMVRVQHVDTAQGPILKRYNLADISISSAATTHTIPFLLVEDADALRSKISELARVAEEDV
jgi:uncharacterized protein